MRYLLEHAHLIVDGQREFLDGALLIDGETIAEVYPHSGRIEADLSDTEIRDMQGSLIMPGFFDTHTHGIDMMSFDDCDQSQLDQISYEVALDGTTSFLPNENIFLAALLVIVILCIVLYFLRRKKK